MIPPRRPYDEPDPPDAGDGRGQGRFGGLSWLWLLILALVLIWNGYTLLSRGATPGVAISYTEFLKQVRSGNVSQVTIAGQNITGEFKTALSPAQLNATEPSATAPAEPTSPGQAGATTQSYTNFRTVVPPQADQLLLPVLQENNVVISAQEVGGNSFLADLALSLLPILVFVGLLLFLGRNITAQGGQPNMFGFAKSRARLTTHERPGVTFSDVAGEDEAKFELQEVVDFLKRPEKYAALGARLPRGVLLVGPPGTGKTLLAKAVAGEAGVPFFSITGSEFVEMVVGVGAARVRDLFENAKRSAPAILFVDEIDAVGRQRGTGLGGGNDEREQTLNQMLAEMDGFDESTNVIVLAATNRPDVLDPALLRPGRFDRQVTLGLPDRKGREAILKVHTRRLKLGPDINIEILARRTPGFSGADLANLANEAALYAARRNAKEITMEDFNDAMDKVILGTRQATIMSEAEQRMVAYHESGHALVAKLTPGADPVSRVSIIPHGQALGVTQQMPEEERHSYPKDYLEGRLASMLGGRAAEELVFGQPSTGAEADLKQATELARRMVGLWGMSHQVGPVYYGVGETHPFLGREISQAREYADATAAELDAETRKLIEKAQRRACDILRENRAALDALVAELLAHETVDAARLNELLAGLQASPDQLQPAA